MIRTIRDISQFVRDHGYRAWIHKLLIDRGWNMKIDWSTIGEVEARIIESKWMAYCPELECSGAMAVDTEEPIFFCVDCLNANNDNRPYKLIFKHKEQVEELLSKRKNPQHRNWLLDETIEDLIKEQEERGEL